MRQFNHTQPRDRARIKTQTQNPSFRIKNNHADHIKPLTRVLVFNYSDVNIIYTSIIKSIPHLEEKMEYSKRVAYVVVVH